MPSEQWYRNQGLSQIQAQREAAVDAVRAQIERERQAQMRQQQAQAQAQSQAQASRGYVQRPPREPRGAWYPERSGETAYHQVHPGYETSRGQMTNGQVWQQQRQQQQQAQDRGSQGYQYHHTSGQQRHGDQDGYYGGQSFYDGVWPGYNADFE